MKHQCFTCGFCGSSLTTLYYFKGYSNLWASDLTDPKPFSFLSCSHCGYTKNLDYKNPDFASIDYSNHTLSLQSDFREIVLAKKITSYAKDLYRDDHPIAVVEIGPGKRLGFLHQIIEHLMPLVAYGVDPIYRNYRNYSSMRRNSVATFLFFSASLSYVRLPTLAHRIVIFRNSIEYYSPQDLQLLFTELFTQDSLLIIELTVLDIGRKGSSHTYSECRNFFSLDVLQAVLKKSCLTVIPIETTYLHGDGRVLWIARVIPDWCLPKLTIFATVSDLVQALGNLKLMNKAVMWGAGGRNVMSLVNEMSPYVHHFTDADACRRDIRLPATLGFVDPRAVSPNDVVICLNHRHLESIRASIPDANVFLFLD